MQHTEGDFLNRLKSPDTRNVAFDELVRLYQRPLYYHIRRMLNGHEDTDDVLQNTFLAAWRFIEQFRGDASLKTWLYRIATNETLSFIEKQKKRQRSDLTQLENTQSHSSSAQPNLSSDEIVALLTHAIATLPEKQKLVFNMRYYDEMSFREISEILETTEGGLKANYHHAVKKIESFISQKSQMLHF